MWADEPTETDTGYLYLLTVTAVHMRTQKQGWAGQRRRAAVPASATSEPRGGFAANLPGLSGDIIMKIDIESPESRLWRKSSGNRKKMR
jgi:hypothetical protein